MFKTVAVAVYIYITLFTAIRAFVDTGLDALSPLSFALTVLELNSANGLRFGAFREVYFNRIKLIDFAVPFSAEMYDITVHIWRSMAHYIGQFWDFAFFDVVFEY